GRSAATLTGAPSSPYPSDPAASAKSPAIVSRANALSDADISTSSGRPTGDTSNHPSAPSNTHATSATAAIVSSPMNTRGGYSASAGARSSNGHTSPAVS